MHKADLPDLSMPVPAWRCRHLVARTLVALVRIHTQAHAFTHTCTHMRAHQPHRHTRACSCLQPAPAVSGSKPMAIRFQKDVNALPGMPSGGLISPTGVCAHACMCAHVLLQHQRKQPC